MLHSQRTWLLPEEGVYMLVKRFSDVLTVVTVSTPQGNNCQGKAL